MVRRSARLSSRANWAGGYYELGLELAGRDDARLRSVARTLWRVATVEGEASFDGFPDDVDPRGVVALPGGARTVARLYAFRSFDDAGDEQTSDWVCLALPLGALTRTDGRIGAFPPSETEVAWTSSSGGRHSTSGSPGLPGTWRPYRPSGSRSSASKRWAR